VFSAARLWQGGQGRVPVGLGLGLGLVDEVWCLCASISRNDVRLSDGCACGEWLCLDGALTSLALAARCTGLDAVGDAGASTNGALGPLRVNPPLKDGALPMLDPVSNRAS